MTSALHFVSSDPLATARVNLASGTIAATRDFRIVALVLALPDCVQARLLLSKVNALALARQLTAAAEQLPDIHHQLRSKNDGC